MGLLKVSFHAPWLTIPCLTGSRDLCPAKLHISDDLGLAIQHLGQSGSDLRTVGTFVATEFRNDVPVARNNILTKVPPRIPFRLTKRLENWIRVPTTNGTSCHYGKRNFVFPKANFSGVLLVIFLLEKIITGESEYH